jgi:hypothetical protein
MQRCESSPRCKVCQSASEYSVRLRSGQGVIAVEKAGSDTESDLDFAEAVLRGWVSLYESRLVQCGSVH